MTENMKKLLDILYENRIDQRYFSSHELSEMINISSRQIRKYVAKINEEIEPSLIISNHKGYKLDADAYHLYTLQCKIISKSLKTRKMYIIQHLINSENGYNIFDLSDELYVSLPTIESDLKSIRRLLESFDIGLQRDHDLIWIIGTENNKRLLLQHLLSASNYNQFALKEQVHLLSYQYHHQDIYSIIRNIFFQNDIFANDYTLNNTIMHLIVMIDRIRNGYNMNEDVTLDEFIDTPQYHVALKIQEYIENNFSIKINDAELYNLILIISNNTTQINYSSINAVNIHEYIEDKYIKIVRETLDHAEAYYCLDAFDDDFFVKFTLHVKNMFQRIEKQYIIKNPLTKMLKTTYPLIYDIAVFIALEFKANYDIQINEDEIAFLAFHIGSYFENNHNNKINCIFIYIDYYNTYQKMLDKLIQQYADYLYIDSAISVHNYDPKLIHADLILSMSDLAFTCEHVILHPILQDTDYHNIDHAIKKISNRKSIELLKNSLQKFFKEELFFSDIRFESRETALEFLCKNVVKLDLAYDDLYQNVMVRECMSSTAFDNVAIPHSVSRNAKHNFISIAISQSPIQWDQNHNVQLIILIGISKEDRQLFSSIFQELINILSNPHYVKKLITCKTLPEFTSQLSDMVGTT